MTRQEFTAPEFYEDEKLDEIDKAAVKAMKATNLCMKHMKYHGQKYASCTPQERVLIKVVTHTKSSNIKDKIE